MVLKKEFYFVRHGQTNYNISTPTADCEDISLNATGLQQAHSIEPIIATLPIQTICFSPLKRAKETKEVIAARLSASHIEMPDLSECTLKVWDDMVKCGPNPSDDEPVNQFLRRVKKGINEALALEGPTLIVAHGGIHWALCSLMAISDHSWRIPNCTPVHFFPDPSGQWKAHILTPTPPAHAII